MIRALGRMGLVFLLTTAAPALAQQAPAENEDTDGPLTEDIILFPGPDLWVSGTTNEGRKDVREVTLPPPPTGPATPIPFCSPGSPVCP
jgi:hypothetical protein